MYIFLDESGDLGFDFDKENSSQKFIITLLVCSNPVIVRKVKTAVRKTTRNKLSKPADKAHELKGSKTSLEVKNYFLKKMPENGWNLYCLALNKKRVNKSLTTKKGRNKSYNYLARLILGKINIPDSVCSVTITVDRSKSKEDVQDFNTYIESHLNALIPPETPLYISHESSQENPGLQAVDLFSWGIFRKHERNDLEWYSQYAEHITFETVYWL